MSEQENISIGRKVIDGFNSHNLDATVQYLADSVKTTDPSFMEVMDKGKTRTYNKRFLDAFPDLHFDTKDIVAQGDTVALFWVAKGTHKAPLQNPMGDPIPPTNKTVQVHGCTLYELRNGMIVRQEIYWDQLAFLTQLGVVSPQELTAHMRR
jgi:steroid delta-isomerase-like uncharacterized protein